MTTLERRPQQKEAMRRFELKSPTSPPPRPVRWIAWTFSIIVLAAAAIAALVLASDSTEPFEEIYEAGSPLAYGAVHEPGFEVGFRWGGESDMTLEEYEIIRGYEATIGEADRVLERYVNPATITSFTPQQLAALQASLGVADWKYLQMTPTG